MNNLLKILCLLIFSSTAATAETIPKFKIMTEDWVPYQFVEGSELRGISVDLMVELLKRVGSTQNRGDIQLLPWARAYRNLNKIENTILFSMTRTSERESLFRWVGPIFQNTTFLIAAKKRHIKISSLEDLQKYVFGTIRDDASEMFLIRSGLNFDAFERTSSSQTALRMLNAGRFDMIASGWENFVSDIAILGLNQNDFEKVYTIDTSDISIAFHWDTPDWIIDNFQQAFDEIKTEGMYDQIFKKYKSYESDE